MDGQLLVTMFSGFFIVCGVVALLVGSLGLLRLPDVYCRIHAVGMIDTAGASFIILGMIIHEGFTLVSVKLVLIGVFLFLPVPLRPMRLRKLPTSQVWFRLAVIWQGSLVQKM